jgi:hypothetical protein
MKTNAVVLLTNLAVVVGWPGGFGRAAEVPDTTPPRIINVGSLNGEGVNVCFSEPMAPVSASQPTNYTVSSRPMPNGTSTVIRVTHVMLRPGGQSLHLDLERPLKYSYISYFTVWATNLQDLAGNLITNPWYRSESGLGVGSGEVAYYYEANLPQPGVNPLELGKVFDLGPGQEVGAGPCLTGYQVTAGGSGLMTNVDGFHYLFDSYTGDFDLRLPVLRLDPVNRWSMAGIVVRESFSAGARCVNVMVTPEDVPTLDGSGRGANCYLATYRDVVGRTMQDWPGSTRIYGLKYPGPVVLLTRRGQRFKAAGRVGSYFYTLGELTLSRYLPETVWVGMATTSGNNQPGFTTVAHYGGLGPSSVSTPLPLRLHLGRSGSNAVLSWLGLSGYRAETARGLAGTEHWTPLTNPVVKVEGSNYLWLDPLEVPQGFFRLGRP